MESSVNTVAIGFFFGVIALTLVITYWAARRSHSTKQLYAAGGNITATQNGLAISGDLASAALFLGGIGMFFTSGYDATLYFFPAMAGFIIMLGFIAGPMRKLGRFTFTDAAAARLSPVGATPENLAALRSEMGLDRSAPARYLEWLGNAVRGDFGSSIVSKTPVAEAIGTRFGNTLFLALYAAIIAVPVAIFLGVLVALFRNTVFDRVANIVTLTSISSPEFFLGYILILFLSVKTGYFPAIANIDDDMSLFDKLNRTFLPALTMVLVVVAHMMRMTRASIINLLASPYVEMAKLKGVPAWKVIVKHTLPNAWAPVINVVALNLAYLVTGVVLVEVVFVYPGIGQLLVDAVTKRDFPVVQACCLIFAATFILLNLAADVGSILTNPRLRHPK